MKIQWINTDGGPVVCAAPTSAKQWRGVQGSSIGAPQSDYDRACDVLDYVGAVACGSSQVLVLGDEPLQSTFVQGPKGLLIVRWVSCQSKEFADQVVTQIPATLPELEEPTSFHVEEPELFVFDAANDCGNPDFSMQATLPVGDFVVTTESYEQEKVFRFLVHRFLRAQT